MSNKNDFKYLVITKQWLEQAGCFNQDGSINIEKLNKLTKGHKYLLDEMTFLPEFEKHVNSLNTIARTEAKIRELRR
ncbi:hypothetical protein [Bacillus pseudomycoides]|uniref:hypothetical protein n=1 Tax=Bacillus pseudomycoides TaxID=64104 RepID=UPI000BEC419E|nr:hypothetical protein [Bacillus pseudomycoides]PEB42229.1 hypothetical protein COO06_07915 [Bacillus pseudomycoides]